MKSRIGQTWVVDIKTEEGELFSIRLPIKSFYNKKDDEWRLEVLEKSKNEKMVYEYMRSMGETLNYPFVSNAPKHEVVIAGSSEEKEQVRYMKSRMGKFISSLENKNPI